MGAASAAVTGVGAAATVAVVFVAIAAIGSALACSLSTPKHVAAAVTRIILTVARNRGDGSRLGRGTST